MVAPSPDVRRALRLDSSGSNRRWGRVALVGLVLLVATGGLVVFLRKRAERQVPRWETQRATKTDLRVTVTTTGNIKGSSIVEVGAEVTGKLLHVDVDYNDRVAKGQLLAEIDPEQLRAAVDEVSAQLLAAEANIKTAQATLAEAKQTRARAEDQAKQGLVSQKDLEAAVAAALRAEASVASATANASLSRATLKSAQSKLNKTKIYAPIDGIVLSRSVETGQTVTAGFTTPVLFKLASDLTKLELDVDVDEADVGRVREGMEATFTVDAYPSRTFPSKVLSLHNDPTTSSNVVTYQGVLGVENTDRALRPGMTATATITSETIRDVLTVPNAALRFLPPVQKGGFGPPPAIASPSTKADEKHVYVLRAGQPAMVSIKTGASDGHVTQVVDGQLSVGDEVIVDVAQPN